jgi:hypothetical protein
MPLYIALKLNQLCLALFTEWLELSSPLTLEVEGGPLPIGKQEVRACSHLYGEYVDPWIAVIFMSRQRQCLHW